MTLRTAGHAIDPRIDVLACPKTWKEADVWQSARYGGEDLWARAHTEEYLQKSRAFMQMPQMLGSRRSFRRALPNEDPEFEWLFHLCQAAFVSICPPPLILMYAYH
jgi:hypothetical protein